MTLKNVKTAAIISDVVIALYFITTISYIVLQRNFNDYETEQFAIPLNCIPFFIAGGVVIAINSMLIGGKVKGISSVVTPAVTLVVYPIFAQCVSFIQRRVAAYSGADLFAVTSYVSGICNTLSYLLMIGAVITISAAAVNCYHVKITSQN